MKYIFDANYIKDNELAFWIYVISMILIMVLTIIFVKKELKHENR